LKAIARPARLPRRVGIELGRGRAALPPSPARSGPKPNRQSRRLIMIWLEVRILPGPPRILSNREISRRRPRSPQLAGFCGCVSVSADTVSGLKAILGRLSLGRGIPFPRCRSIWPAQPDHGAGACLTAGTTGCSEQRSNASTGSQAGGADCFIGYELSLPEHHLLPKVVTRSEGRGHKFESCRARQDLNGLRLRPVGTKPSSKRIASTDRPVRMLT
jgi:hypothetical protein